MPPSAPHPPPDSNPGRPMKAPATTGKPSATFTGSAGRRRGAGPFRTRAPALRSNSEKWHGHLTVLVAGDAGGGVHRIGGERGPTRGQIGERDDPALAVAGGQHEPIVRLRTSPARVAFLGADEACQRQADADTERQGQNATTAGPGDRRGPSWCVAHPRSSCSAAGRSRRPDNCVAEESSPRRTMSRSLAATAPHRVDDASGKDLTTRGWSSRIAPTSAAWVWCLETGQLEVRS